MGTPDSGEEVSVARALVNDLTVAMLNFNEAAFEKSYAEALSRFGLFEAMLQVVYPLLNRIGILWASDHAMPVFCQRTTSKNEVTVRLSPTRNQSSG